MSQNKPARRMTPFAFLFELLIDLALMGMGAALYYHFQVRSLGPVDLSPVLVELFGNRQIAVLVISIVPFGVGLFNLLRAIYRVVKGLIFSQKAQSAP